MSAPMNDEDFGMIDMKEYSSNKSREAEDSAIDMNEYGASPEAESASWWELAKDLIVQPALGAAGAYTWPADVLKIGMVGEGLSDIDELEDAFKKAGKPFDRDEYIREVAKNSEYIPTQGLLEDWVSSKTGIDLEPKSDIGKAIRKGFFLRQLTRGQGLGKSARAGVVGAGTTAGLKAAGAPEVVAELGGDVAGIGSSSLGKSARVLSLESAELEKIASKHGLPFPEYLTRDAAERASPVITQARRDALQQEIGKTSQQAIDEVIAGKLPVSKLRQQGADLEVLTEDAYDKVKELARANPKPISTKQIVSDIDAEIARIRSEAPSPSDADLSAIELLEKEKSILQKSKPTTEQAVEQIKKYNKNAGVIYKRPEFSGREDAVRRAYAFLNNSIRNTVEAESGTEVRSAMRAADELHGAKSRLDRAEGLVSKAFVNGEYNPKKLKQVLNSKEGLIVRRELGEEALKDIRDIANYGEQAVKATDQLAKSPKYAAQIAEWGPLAGVLLHKIPKIGLLAAGARPLANRVRGYLLMRPATREVYGDIIRNASNGSFKNMRADFKQLEAAIEKDYGNVDDFMDSMMDDLVFSEEDLVD